MSAPLAREVVLADSEATEALGASLTGLADDAVVLLRGDLGAGKTTLVRGFLRALGHAGPVRSPTYTLVESYDVAGLRVHHFDLYRLQDPDELEEFGIRDYFAEPAWRFVEWPERGAGVLPPADLEIRLEVRGEGRVAHLEGVGRRGPEWLRDRDDAGDAIR